MAKNPKKSEKSIKNSKKNESVQVKDLQALREEILQEAQKRATSHRRGIARQITPLVEHILLPQRVVMQIADEVAARLTRKRTDKKTTSPKQKYAEPIFLDTSAILDERLFALIKLGVFSGNMILLESVLSELKHIADLKDDIKKERGRRALKALEEVKKQKNIKLEILRDEGDLPVDDKLIEYAKRHKGKVITGDFNLSKKARISNVTAIDIHEVANALKTQAIPGEIFWVKVIQAGKGENQGVGYLPDGTMIVVEQGKDLIGKTIQVEVSRIIQTEAGKILFSKVIVDESGV